MKNAVYVNVVETRKQLCQCMKDVGNEIRAKTWASERAEGCVHATKEISSNCCNMLNTQMCVSQASRISQMLKHYNIEILPSATFNSIISRHVKCTLDSY